MIVCLFGCVVVYRFGVGMVLLLIECVFAIVGHMNVVVLVLRVFLFVFIVVAVSAGFEVGVQLRCPDVHEKINIEPLQHNMTSNINNNNNTKRARLT